MNYCQLHLEERSVLATLKRLGWSVLEMARELGRHRSTVARELRRNVTAYDGWYRAGRAHEQAVARRRRSRRNRHFGHADLAPVEALLREEWSPEQVAGYLRRKGRLLISHETIYGHVWRDWRAGGTLHLHLRGARKQCRKRYRSYDSRGRLAGKRHISERPAAVETRQRIGHWEIDTVMGERSDCVVTLVERKTGFVLIGKLRARTKEHTIAAIVMLIRRYPGRFRTITSDNGTEFHCYRQIEAATGVRFYFATPHHAWERGTNENTNGLLRQYLPKGHSMASLTQPQCDAIAEHLNNRPRKRHAYKTPHECFRKS